MTVRIEFQMRFNMMGRIYPSGSVRNLLTARTGS